MRRILASQDPKIGHNEGKELSGPYEERDNEANRVSQDPMREVYHPARYPSPTHPGYTTLYIRLPPMYAPCTAPHVRTSGPLIYTDNEEVCSGHQEGEAQRGEERPFFS